MGVGKTVIILLTQSSRAGARTELGKNCTGRLQAGGSVERGQLPAAHMFSLRLQRLPGKYPGSNTRLKIQLPVNLKIVSITGDVRRQTVNFIQNVNMWDLLVAHTD